MQIQNLKITYNFEDQVSIGKQGEDLLDQWLNSLYTVIDVSDIKQYQKRGIDRVLIRPDQSVVTVEYKFDLASARTGNLFFETVSIDTRNIPGWGWSSEADYWIFLLPSKEVLVIEPSKFRDLIWKSRFKFKEKKVSNSDYNTYGIPIPINKVKEIAHFSTKLSS